MLLNNRHKFQKWKFAQCNLELTTDSKVKIFHKSSNSSCRKIAICIQLFEQLEALVYVTNNHRTFAITEYCHSRLPIMAPFMSGKSRVRKYENIVWITILSASLNNLIFAAVSFCMSLNANALNMCTRSSRLFCAIKF